MTTPEALRAKMWNDDGVKETRRVVLVLIRCEEIELVVEWLEEKYGHIPDFIIEDRGPYYRIDCAEGLEVDLDEIEPIIGHSYNVFDFLVSVSTAVKPGHSRGATSGRARAANWSSRPLRLRTAGTSCSMRKLSR